MWQRRRRVLRRSTAGSRLTWMRRQPASWRSGVASSASSRCVWKVDARVICLGEGGLWEERFLAPCLPCWEAIITACPGCMLPCTCQQLWHSHPPAVVATLLQQAQLDQQVQEAAAARQRDKQPASGAAGGALLLPQGREGGGDAAARRAEHARQLQQQMQSKQQVATRVKAWQHQQEAQRLAALAVEGVAAEAKRRTAATVHAETLRRMLDQQVQARQARTAAWPDK